MRSLLNPRSHSSKSLALFRLSSTNFFCSSNRNRSISNLRWKSNSSSLLNLWIGACKRKSIKRWLLTSRLSLIIWRRKARRVRRCFSRGRWDDWEGTWREGVEWERWWVKGSSFDRTDDGDNDRRLGDGGEDSTREDSEEVRLAVSLDSPAFSLVDEIVLRPVGAAEEVRFLAGRWGISFPGNSCRSYYQHNIVSNRTSWYSFLNAPYRLAT